VRIPVSALLLASVVVVPGLSPAQESRGFPSGASYEACGMIASQYLTTIQLVQQGFDPPILKQTLPGLTDKGAERIDAMHEQIEQNGLVETYSGVNARFASCASRVNDNRGNPERGTREHHFYVCAGENKVRYEILLAALAGGGLEEVRPQLAEPHRRVADKIFRRLEETDVATVFREMASELKACLNKGAGR